MERQKYNCLVIEDEPIARKIISGYIEQMPSLTLKYECKNAFSAIESLRTSTDIDIIFLDINMPNLSGIQFMKIGQPAQPVIFTTAYTEYAVESYELNAADYLLKPFSFDRFTIAVYKAIDHIAKSYPAYLKSSNESDTSVFIKSDGKIFPVLITDILYCEAMKNYTMIVLKNEKKLMPLIPLFKIEKLLLEAGGEFIQIHRSFLVAKKQITAIRGSEVIIDKISIPIGLQYKERFFQLMGMGRKE